MIRYREKYQRERTGLQKYKKMVEMEEECRNIAGPYRSDPAFTGPAGYEVRIQGQALTRLPDS